MTILTIVEKRRDDSPSSNVLFAPGRPPLSAEMLCAHVVDTAKKLRAAGLRKNDVIAVVLPNGPEMATAFLSVSTAGICAPLNPAYGRQEMEFYLADLPAAALVIAGLPDSPARDVARELGIPVLELSWSATDPAGVFATGSEAHSEELESIEPRSSDVALVLHTSGTTSRPKIVPLTHENLCASAASIGTTLRLEPEDKCLNVMPLFHIHGLVAALLSSLRAGGSVVCTSGFNAPNFFQWIDEFRPTWYTAVPTMHAAVVARAVSHRDELTPHSLRLVRSSSAALPRSTFDELEKLFGVPVIEAYGMTEAAHQMSSNPLPPQIRKPGTVGKAAGPEIAVLDLSGKAAPRGVRGEVAIRGPSVTTGYVRNPAANQVAFIDGWLKTGDEGMLDADGYLTILGRLKEIINRGGEKISPLEVDDVLMSHPVVAQAVTFAASDDVLGEEVAAAVVLRPGTELTERQLREFVSTRLTHFKVPRRILFMEKIPTGPTGKMQRIGLADRLGISFTTRVPTRAAYVAPRSPVEEILSSIWAEVFLVDAPGIDDNFFDAGGDSTLAMQFISRVRDSLAVEISLISFFDSPTIAGLASVVEESIKSEASST